MNSAAAEPRSRVLVLSHGGRLLDRRIVSQANALAGSGRAVTLASSPFDRDAADLDPRVEVITGPEPVGGVEQRLGLRARLPIPVHAVSRWAWYKLRGGPARGVRDYVASLRLDDPFDVIHAHDLPTLPAAVELRDRLGCQLIYDAHELYPFQHAPGVQRSYWSAAERRAISRADAVVTVSPSFAEQLSERYRIGSPAVIYNACEAVERPHDEPRRLFAERFGLAPDEHRTRVVFQGSQTIGRGLKRLISAIGSRADRFVLGMIGSGPAHDALVAHAQAEAPGSVFFASFAPQRDLLGILAGADLGVIPYGDDGLLNSRYCSPNKLFEFIEAGLPILANDLPEIRRVIDRYALGVAAPMEDTASLAEGFDLIADRIDANAFGAGSFDRARRELGWETQRRELLQIYESLGC